MIAYMIIVIVCLVIMYLWPDSLGLPNFSTAPETPARQRATMTNGGPGLLKEVSIQIELLMTKIGGSTPSATLTGSGQIQVSH